MNIEQYRKEHCTDFVSDKCEHQEHANMEVISELKRQKVVYTNTNIWKRLFLGGWLC